MTSENGWEPARVTPDQCEWVTVPGTNPSVNLQLLKGQPLSILRAFAADFNAFIEPLRDADSAAWTPTNAVATSNHLNATAMDLNWNSHPFRVLNAGFNDAQIATARELLAFYENTVWWGNDWDSPKDAMHWNMGYNTFNNPHTADFIARKIRVDGFSTFHRGARPPSKQDEYALAVLTEGRRRGISERGIMIAFATVFVESNWRLYANERVPESMAIPHDAVGSDAYSVGLFQQQVRDTGNGWWWGDAATCMNPTLSAGLFYDRLAKLDYNSPAHSPGYFAQSIQQSAFPSRYDDRFGDAAALYQRIVGTPTIPPPTPTGEGFLMALSDAEQHELLELCRQQTGYQRVSRSPLRHLDENPTETIAGFSWNTDGSVHALYVLMRAKLGDPVELALLREVAGGDPAKYPDRKRDIQLAQAILADLAKPDTPYTPAPQPVPNLPATTNGAGVSSIGQIISNLYDVLDKLELSEALDIKDRVTLAATIKVLETKAGTPT